MLTGRASRMQHTTWVQGVQYAKTMANEEDVSLRLSGFFCNFFFQFSSTELCLGRVREYNALYRLEWPSDLHYSSRRLEASRSDTPLKFSPGAKKGAKRESERAREDDRSRA